MKVLSEKQEKILNKRLSSQRRSSVHLTHGSKELNAINPFQTKDRMTPQDWVELVLGVIFLLPLRLLGIVIVTCVISLLLTLSALGKDISKPLPDHILKFQYFVGTKGSLLICYLCGIYNIRIKGRKADPAECKMFVVAPHSTCLDAVVMGATVGAAGVAKDELAATPIIGAGMVAGQTLFVKRDGKDSRKAIADAIKERIKRKSPWNRALLLFPEGTCTNRTSLISFRRGAFEPGASVQPVVLSWKFESFDPSWTAGSLNRTLIVLRTLTQLRHDVTVTFLPVVEPTEEEQADAALFTNNVRAKMAAELGVPTSEFSYNDMFLAKAAAKAKLQPAFVLPFTFASLESEVKSISKDIPKERLFEDTKSVLQRFSKAPKMTGEGRLSESQFNSISEKLHKDLDLRDGALSFTALSDAARQDGTVSFHTLLLACLAAKYT